MRAFDGLAKLIVTVLLVAPGARPALKLIVAYGCPLYVGRSGNVTPGVRFEKNTYIGPLSAARPVLVTLMLLVYLPVARFNTTADAFNCERLVTSTGKRTYSTGMS